MHIACTHIHTSVCRELQWRDFVYCWRVQVDLSRELFLGDRKRSFFMDKICCFKLTFKSANSSCVCSFFCWLFFSFVSCRWFLLLFFVIIVAFFHSFLVHRIVVRFIQFHFGFIIESLGLLPNTYTHSEQLTADFLCLSFSCGDHTTGDTP